MRLALTLAALFVATGAAAAELRCDKFTDDIIAAPEPRAAPSAVPRAEKPDAALRQATLAVNRLIQRCHDGTSVVYADIGGALLDPDGRLDPAVSPDRLHFSAAGYARLMPSLDGLIDRLFPAR